MIQKKQHNRRKKKKKDFNPTRSQISIAVAEFIENGGTINKIEEPDHDYSEYARMSPSEADAFLRDEL